MTQVAIFSKNADYWPFGANILEGFYFMVIIFKTGGCHRQDQLFSQSSHSQLSESYRSYYVATSGFWDNWMIMSDFSIIFDEIWSKFTYIFTKYALYVPNFTPPPVKLCVIWLFILNIGWNWLHKCWGIQSCTTRLEKLWIC